MRYLWIFMCIALCGCQVFITSKPKVPAQSAVNVCLENPRPVNEEKVWVEAKTNKIWIGPHVDENGDFVEGHYKHVVITPGHWATKDEAKRE